MDGAGPAAAGVPGGDVESVAGLLFQLENLPTLTEGGLDVLLRPAGGLADAAAFVGGQSADAAQDLA